MTPTPEQVAAWAREADSAVAFQAGKYVEGVSFRSRDEWLCLLAFNAGRAEQAEQDASTVRFAGSGKEAAAVIRANAPKVTT